MDEDYWTIRRLSFLDAMRSGSVPGVKRLMHGCRGVSREFNIYGVCCRNGIGAGCYPVLLKCSTGSNPVHTALLAYRNGYNGAVLKTDVTFVLWVRIPPQALERTIFPIFTSYLLVPPISCQKWHYRAHGFFFEPDCGNHTGYCQLSVKVGYFQKSSFQSWQGALLADKCQKLAALHSHCRHKMDVPQREKTVSGLDSDSVLFRFDLLWSSFFVTLVAKNYCPEAIGTVSFYQW